MLGAEVEVDRRAAETCFSGVVRVDRAGEPPLVRAYGMANRALGLPNRVDTLVGTASVIKGLTAVCVLSLVEEGALGLATPARSLLGADLPLIDDGVTERVLAHRSGIGDFSTRTRTTTSLITSSTSPVHLLTDAESSLLVLDGHPMVSAPGERPAERPTRGADGMTNQ